MASTGRTETDIGVTIAARLRAIRGARGLTLDALASASGVSRAMLSRIERGESSPTAGTLAKLCDGLGVALAALLGDEAEPAGEALARRARQPVWRDPGSGYLRRAVSPAAAGSRVEIAEIELPAGASVLLDAVERKGLDWHAWVLAGAVEVARDGGTLTLGCGDCLRLARDRPAAFRNAGAEPARCALIVGRALRAAPES